MCPICGTLDCNLTPYECELEETRYETEKYSHDDTPSLENNQSYTS